MNKSPVLYTEDDLVFFMTEKCNSNCIMCPMSLDSRKRGIVFTDEEWNYALTTLEDNVNHITITGGEPFLDFKHLVSLLDFIKDRYPNVPILVLTNGRALSIHSVWLTILPFIKNHMRFAIPIHGPAPVLHDAITQTKGSFEQTIEGLKNLGHSGAEIEIRIVTSKINKEYLSDICYMLAQSDLRIDRVNLVAMEMHGCAASNREILWADYNELYSAAAKGIQRLVLTGIDVGLYNFPLCSIPKNVWGLAKESISTEKIRYPLVCDECIMKNACCGLFSSTMSLKLYNPKPIH